MTYPTIVKAVQEILDPMIAVWTPTGYPVNYPDTNTANTPPEGTPTPWAWVNLNHADGGQATLACVNGVKRWERVGVLLIQVFAPIGQGNTVTYGLAQSVANAYMKAKPPGGAWFRNHRIRDAGSSGPYTQVNFILDFQYEQLI